MKFTLIGRTPPARLRSNRRLTVVSTLCFGALSTVGWFEGDLRYVAAAGALSLGSAIFALLTHLELLRRERLRDVQPPTKTK